MIKASTGQWTIEEGMTGKYGIQCLPPGTPVFNQGNVILIEDLKNKLTQVSDRYGASQNIVSYLERDIDEDAVQIKIRNLPWFTITKEHPILIARFDDDINRLRDNMKWWSYSYLSYKMNIDFVKAENVRRGDYVLIPLHTPKKPLERIKVWSGHKKKYDSHKHGPTEITIDKDFCYFLGWYLAEGYVSKSCKHPILSVNTYHDIDFMKKRIVPYFEKLSIKASIYRGQSPKTAVVQVLDKYFGQFIWNLIPRHAKEKYIPSFVFDLPEEPLLEFLRGYGLGDGFVVKRNETPIGISFTTSSLYIAYQLFYLLLSRFKSAVTLHHIDFSQYKSTLSKNSQGYVITVYSDIASKILPDVFKQKKGSNPVLIIDNYALLRVDSIRTVHYKGKVYNIAVSYTHLTLPTKA